MNKKISTLGRKEISAEREAYLAGRKRKKLQVRACQIALLVLFIAAWEVFARLGVIDSFIMSSPSRILRTLANFSGNGLLVHVGITCFETLVGFGLGALIGNAIAFTLWWSPFLARVAAPYLVVLNALPKIALGPVIIVWVGAGMQAIIVMALAISLIVTVLEMLGGFASTDKELIKMAKTFGATRWQTFVKIIYPSNLQVLFGSLKINIGLSLVGVIAGEFLVSRAGLGYLIIYGGQVFQMDLVMTSVLLLGVLAALLYGGVALLEKKVMKFVQR
ncbi:MAG: ABC transporter permease [Oscillospiraceae bacterium]|nr:ABC transporter permease [Oscillospiraceae bacterium]